MLYSGEWVVCLSVMFSQHIDNSVCNLDSLDYMYASEIDG